MGEDVIPYFRPGSYVRPVLLTSTGVTVFFECDSWSYGVAMKKVHYDSVPRATLSNI